MPSSDYSSPFHAENWKDEMIGDFHMEEYKHWDKGHVYWLLNLKDDEEMRRGDAFLYDHMLDYVDEAPKSNEYYQEQNPVLRQLLTLNELKNFEELAAQ